MTDHPLPHSVCANAWIDGGPVGSAELDPDLAKSGALVAPIESGSALLKPGATPDEWDWTHDDIGWGLVLPENPDVPTEQRSTPVDAADAVQALWEHRGERPVLRYDPNASVLEGLLVRYDEHGAPNRIGPGAARGTGPEDLPGFLLIAAPPSSVPWSAQFTLGHLAHVGRLDPSDGGMDNYVAAVVGEWAAAGADPASAVVWSPVNDGDGGMTELMADVVAAPIHEDLDDDADIGGVFLDGRASADDATIARLTTELTARTPGLVVTTSHGNTGPLDDVAKLRQQLGLLIDSAKTALDPATLLASWTPGGAIWYSHACCSAGVSGTNRFKNLVQQGTGVDKLFSALPTAGEMIAPFPSALLRAEHPVRGFVGHVEPTMDWTLRNKKTGTSLTSAIQRAFYQRLYQPRPIGYALDEIRRQATQLHAAQDAAKQRFGAGNDTKGDLLALTLMARDLESMVLLGDPAAALPSL